MAKYIVLDSHGEQVRFNEHSQAFGFCQTLASYPKGVFQIIGETNELEVIAGLNVWAKMFDARLGEQAIKNANPEFIYKVI